MFRFLLLLLVTLNVFAHGGDSGPSSLEQEFSKLAHVHLPVNFSPSEGLSFGIDLGTNESHSGFSVESHPVAFGGFDKISRLTCLSRSYSEVLENCSESDPYQLLQNRKWDLGTGAEAHTHLPLPGLSMGVGFGYMKGKTYYTVLQLNHKKEKRKFLELPLSPETFSSWRKGDELFYMTKSTLYLSAVLEYGPIIHIGPQVSKTGIFRISLKKSDDTHLIAEIGSVKSRDFTFEAYALVAGAELSGGKNKAESLTYEFDMTNERSFMALELFLKGRIDLLHSLLLAGDLQAKLKTKNRGISLSGGFGFPVLYMNGGYRGTYRSSGKYDMKEEDGSFHEHEIFSIAQVKDHFTRGVLSDHKWENSMLTTTILREIADPDESIMTVAWNWTFSRDHLRSRELFRKLNKIDQKFRTDMSRKIQFPRGLKGYVKVNLQFSLNAEMVLKLLSKEERELLEMYQAGKRYEGLVKKLQKMMKETLMRADGFWEGPKRPLMKVTLEGESFKRVDLSL